MREILFRGKRKDNGEWIEGNGIMQGQDGISCARWVDICDDKMRYEVIPESVSRFTGLTDKNGKKIFEGDIVKLFFYDKEQDINYELIGQVESVLCCGFITIYEEKVNALELFNKTISNKIEVIGNRWDNPEFLGEEQ